MRVDSRARTAAAGPKGAERWRFCVCHRVPCRSLVGGALLLPRTRSPVTSGSMKRDVSLTRSPLKPARAVHVRLSQATTLAALTPLDPDSLTRDLPVATCRPAGSSTDLPAPVGAPPDVAPTVSQSPSSPFPGPSCRGSPPLPAPAPVSETVQFVNSDPFARARIAAVQSRVAAPVVSGSRAPPQTPRSRPSKTAPSAANPLAAVSKAPKGS